LPDKYTGDYYVDKLKNKSTTTQKNHKNKQPATVAREGCLGKSGVCRAVEKIFNK